MLKKIPLSPDGTLAQQCFEQIQKEIINGVLKPGEKLKVGLLQERFSIGQSPIREALSRLVSSDLVYIQDNKGFQVSAITEASIRDTYQIFTLIENLALELAIKNGDENWEAGIIAELYKLSLIETKEGFDEIEEWVERNYNFHVTLIAGCNSTILLEIRRNLYMKFDRHCRLAYQVAKQTLPINHEEHKKLADAVLKRDVQKAQNLMTHHINGGLEDVINILKTNEVI